QPVVDAIVESAVTLCSRLFGSLIQFDGELLHFAAQHNLSPEGIEEFRRILPMRPNRSLGVGRAILERALVQIPDTELDPDFAHHALSRAVGWRSGLFVPMLREGIPIGAIGVARAMPGSFSDSEIALLKPFAAQAVIAVENVRLLEELEARNRDLTATSEILETISRSPTDVQPTFDAIAKSAALLCRADLSGVHRFDGELIHFVA